MLNRWFLDPLDGKGYPQDIVEDYQDPMEFLGEGDLQSMAAPLDFLASIIISLYRPFQKIFPKKKPAAG